MIKLTATPESRQDIEELAAFFQGLKSPTLYMRQILGDTVRGLFEEHFDNEGSRSAFSWEGLKDRTRAERRREGYGAEHPILVRSGYYKNSFTNLGAPDNFEQLVTRGDGWTMEFGSDDFRVNELEGGRDNMAARPVTLLDDSEESEIGDVLDRLFRQAADDMGMMRGAA